MPPYVQDADHHVRPLCPAAHLRDLKGLCLRCQDPSDEAAPAAQLLLLRLPSYRCGKIVMSGNANVEGIVGGITLARCDTQLIRVHSAIRRFRCKTSLRSVGMLGGHTAQHCKQSTCKWVACPE